MSVDDALRAVHCLTGAARVRWLTRHRSAWTPELIVRLADEVIYLRSGSLNIFNGMVSLNFSCDGSHYLPYRDFLDRESPFWRSVG